MIPTPVVVVVFLVGVFIGTCIGGFICFSAINNIGPNF